VMGWFIIRRGKVRLLSERQRMFVPWLFLK
jgi:hypothetical protein